MDYVELRLMRSNDDAMYAIIHRQDKVGDINGDSAAG